MLAEYLTSTDDLCKLQKQQRRRVAKLKCEAGEVQITFIGGCYRARLAGSNIMTFGETTSEATQRLSRRCALCVFRSIVMWLLSGQNNEVAHEQSGNQRRGITETLNHPA